MPAGYTPYLGLGYGSDTDENRNLDLLDTKALDLARGLIADIPAGGVLSGTYPDPGFRNEAVDTAAIGDGQVTFSKMAPNSIGVLNLINGAVDRAKLAANVWPNPIPTAGDVGKVLTVAAGPTLVWGAGGGAVDPTLGGDLSGTVSNAVVLKSSGNFTIGAQLFGLANIDPIVWGSRTMKGRLTSSAAGDFYGFTVNAKLTSQQDDPTKPSWAVLARSDALDQFVVGRSPAGGGPFLPLFTVGADGRSTVADFLFATGIELTTTIRLGPSGPAPSDGTLQYTGTKFQGRVAGAWVDIPGTGGGGGIPEAPNDGQTYGRKSLAWAVVPSGGGGPAGPDRTSRTLAGGTTLLDATAEVHYASAISNATLPLAASCPGRIYEFAPANQINVGRSGSDTIVVGTAAGVTLLPVTASMRVTLISDGIAAWRVISADPALSITGIGAGGALVGTYPSPTLAANAVANTNIATGAVSPLKMAGAVPTAGVDNGKFLIYDHTNPTTQWKISSVIQDSSGRLYCPANDSLRFGAVTFGHLVASGGSFRAELRTNLSDAGVLDDNTKPSWAIKLDSALANDRIDFQRYLIGATSGPTTIASLQAPTQSALEQVTILALGRAADARKGRLLQNVVNAFSCSTNWDEVAVAKDVSNQPSWIASLGSADTYKIDRVAQSTTTVTNLLALAAAGDLAIAGHLTTGGVGFAATSGPGLRIGGTITGIRCQSVGTALADGFSNAVAFGWGSSALQARVDATALGTVNITPPSDVRYKTDVQEDCPGLDTVLALRPITFLYDRATREMLPEGRHYGLLAQEAQAHVPLVIEDDGTEDHYLGLDYRKLVPVLIQAIKELTARVAVLEAN